VVAFLTVLGLEATEIIKFGSESISCVVQEALLSGRHQAQFNGMGMHECVLRTGWGGLQ